MRPRFYQPRTKAGTRTLPLVRELVHTLKVWKRQAPPSAHELVFPTPAGTPQHRSTALRRGLYPALRRAKLRSVDMDSLRHRFASALIAQGCSATEVQHYRGHASPTTTLRTYFHWFQAVKTGAVARFAKGVRAENWTLKRGFAR